MVFNNMQSKTILRMADVVRRTGLSKGSIYLKIKSGSFPQPVPLGVRAVGWSEEEVNAWIDQRIEERDSSSVGGRHV